MKINGATVWCDGEMSKTAGGHTYKHIVPFLASPSSGGICFSKTDILKSAGQQGCHCPDHSFAATSTQLSLRCCHVFPPITQLPDLIFRVSWASCSQKITLIAGLDESAWGLERWQIGWNSAQSRPFRSESHEATCICCNSCHLWTCWFCSESNTPLHHSFLVLSVWRQEHQGIKQTGLDIRKYFIARKVSQSWNRSLKQLYKLNPWRFLRFVWMKPKMLILSWCPPFFESKAGLYDLLRSLPFLSFCEMYLRCPAGSQHFFSH